MSCENCQKAQEMGWKKRRAYYFRWKTANIALMGCEEHVKEVMDWLIKYSTKAGEKNRQKRR